MQEVNLDIILDSAFHVPDCFGLYLWVTPEEEFFLHRVQSFLFHQKIKDFLLDLLSHLKWVGYRKVLP
jgi:hypothetical protein